MAFNLLGLETKWFFETCHTAGEETLCLHLRLSEIVFTFRSFFYVVHYISVGCWLLHVWLFFLLFLFVFMQIHISDNWDAWQWKQGQSKTKRKTHTNPQELCSTDSSKSLEIKRIQERINQPTCQLGTFLVADNFKRGLSYILWACGHSGRHSTCLLMDALWREQGPTVLHDLSVPRLTSIKPQGLFMTTTSINLGR